MFLRQFGRKAEEHLQYVFGVVGKVVNSTNCEAKLKRILEVELKR